MGEDIGGEELFFEVGEVGAVFFVRAADDVLEDGEEAFEFEGVGVLITFFQDNEHQQYPFRI